MEESIFVSIVMPYYNASRYLFDAVESIINQTFRNWELIIVDDCSPAAETKKVLHEVTRLDERIRVIRASLNCGAGSARNIGIKEAMGSYIAFCDADDWWYPEKLEKQIRFMQDNGYRFVCSYYEDCDDALNVQNVIRQKSCISFKDLISGCNIGTPGVIYCKNGVEDVRFPEVRRGEDWRMWLRMLSRLDFLYSYPEPLWKYRHVKGSTNSNKFKIVSSVIEVYMDELHYSRFRSYMAFVFVFMPKYIWRKVFKN